MESNSLELLDDDAYISEDRRKVIKLEHTRSGRPAKFEAGGAQSASIGYATIVCGPHGERMLPTYIKKTGPRANGDHALFIVFPGTLFVEVVRKEEVFDVSVFKIKEIVETDDKFEAVAIKILEGNGGVWDKEHLHERFMDAIEAAKKKAGCYHCREIHYGLEMHVRDTHGPDA